MGQRNSTENYDQVDVSGCGIVHEDVPSSDERHKLLLLGTGEAGKSTIYKQITLHFRQGCNIKHENNVITLALFIKLRTFFQLLIRLYGTTGDAMVDRDMNTRPIGSGWYHKYMHGGGISHEAFDSISNVWESTNAQELWKRRDQFQLSESLEYFCKRENLNRMKGPYLEVLPDDYIHLHVMTVGINEMTVDIGGKNVVVVDTGGQRTERAKWIRTFNGVSAIMFVVALDEFDKVLWEDGSINRWEESLTLFAKTVKFRVFRTTPIILVLNRVDLLEKKLAAKEKEGANLDDYFPDLGLGNDYEEALPLVMDYMEQQLVSKLKPMQPYKVQYVNAVDGEAFPQWFTKCSQWMESVCSTN